MIDYKNTLLNISIDDLNSSRILYESGNYSQSVFHMQQSIEKVCKYLALDSEIFQPFELSKKMGHDSLKLFRKLLEKQINNIEAQLNMYDSFTESSDNELYNIANPIRHQSFLKEGLDTLIEIIDYDLQNLSPKHLDELIKLLKESNEIGVELPEEFNKLFNEKTEIIIEWLKRFGLIDNNINLQNLKLKLKDEKSRLFFNNRTKIFLKHLPEYISSIYTIFILSIIFTMHAISSRYADSETGFNPLTFYNKENPLIIRMPIFIEYLRSAIAKIFDFNNIDYS